MPFKLLNLSWYGIVLSSVSLNSAFSQIPAIIEDNNGQNAVFFLRGVNPYYIRNRVLYYAVSNNLTGNQVIDSPAGFKTLDLRSGSQGVASNLLMFDFSTEKANYNVGSGIRLPQVSLYFEEDTSGDPIPIAFAGTAPGDSSAPLLCGSPGSPCILGANNEYVAARYVFGNKLRIGLDPMRICLNRSAPSAFCGTPLNNVNIPPAGSTVRAQIRIVIDNIDPNEVVTVGVRGATPVNAADQMVLTVVMTNASPVIGCPANSQAGYIPGDGEIALIPDKFPVTGPVSATDYVISGNLNTGPNTSDPLNVTNANSNSILGRIREKGGLTIGGFQNITAAAPANAYQLAVYARNDAGLISEPTDSCPLTNVQTSAITGFIKDGRCFIATAAYGSMDHWALDAFRAFRDRTLQYLPGGKAFIKAYYGWSPDASKVLVQHPTGRRAVAIILAPFAALFWVMFFQPFWFALGLLAIGTGFWACRRTGRKIKNSVGLFIVISLMLTKSGFSQEPSISPYIDSVRQSIQTEDAGSEEVISSEDYSNKLKQGVEKSTADGYTEKLRLEGKAADGSEGYSEKLKNKLSEAPEKSAIEDFKAGKEKEGPQLPRWNPNALSLRFGLSPKLDYSIQNQVTTYEAVYGTDFIPDIQFTYERRLFNSWYTGSLSLLLTSGITYRSAYGVFQIPIAGQSKSTVGLTFITVPLLVGANYRFKAFRFVEPYASLSFGTLGLYEIRSDSKDDQGDYAWVYQWVLGVAVPISWISRGSAWDAKNSSGINQMYLSIEYLLMRALFGPTGVTGQGVYAGFTFDF